MKRVNSIVAATAERMKGAGAQCFIS
jgi:hypothetical protein